jgi:hypothetical protein
MQESAWDLSHVLLERGREKARREGYSDVDDLVRNYWKTHDEKTLKDKLGFVYGIYKGKRVWWIGPKGEMFKATPERTYPIEGNVFDPVKFYAAFEAIRRLPPPVVFTCCASAAINRIDRVDVEQSKEYGSGGCSECRPWDDGDIGKYAAQIRDGNHRVFSAFAAGEPYVWVHAGDYSRVPKGLLR